MCGYALRFVQCGGRRFLLRIRLTPRNPTAVTSHTPPAVVELGRVAAYRTLLPGSRSLQPNVYSNAAQRQNGGERNLQ